MVEGRQRAQRIRGPPRSKTIHTGEEEKSVRRWFQQRNKYHFLHLSGSFFLVRQKEKKPTGWIRLWPFKTNATLIFFQPRETLPTTNNRQWSHNAQTLFSSMLNRAKRKSIDVESGTVRNITGYLRVRAFFFIIFFLTPISCSVYSD